MGVEFYDTLLALIPLALTTTTVGLQAVGVKQQFALMGGGVVADGLVSYVLFYAPPIET